MVFTILCSGGNEWGVSAYLSSVNCKCTKSTVDLLQLLNTNYKFRSVLKWHCS